MKYYPCGDCLERDRCYRTDRTNCKSYRDWMEDKNKQNKKLNTGRKNTHKIRINP